MSELDDKETQKEKRRIQNRESQRRWRERNRLRRIRATHQAEFNKTHKGKSKSTDDEPGPSARLEFACDDCPCRARYVAGLPTCCIPVRSPAILSEGAAGSSYPWEEGMLPTLDNLTLNEGSRRRQGTSEQLLSPTERESLAPLESPYEWFEENQTTYENYFGPWGDTVFDLFDTRLSHVASNEAVAPPYGASTSVSSVVSNVPPRIWHDDFTLWAESQMTRTSTGLPNRLPRAGNIGREEYPRPPGPTRRPRADYLSEAQEPHEGPVELIDAEVMVDHVRRMYEFGIESEFWEDDANILDCLELIKTRFQSLHEDERTGLLQSRMGD